jgi:t-SNARE complex subunit (syntaxin)
MREDIKKEERQEQGLLAESDKKNKEKLKTTLHALEEEIEAIRQKKRALLKDNLLTKMIGLQRTQTGDELTKSLFEEIKKYREEEVEKWMDKVDSVSFFSLPFKVFNLLCCSNLFRLFCFSRPSTYDISLSKSFTG